MQVSRPLPPHDSGSSSAPLFTTAVPKGSIPISALLSPYPSVTASTPAYASGGPTGHAAHDPTPSSAERTELPSLIATRQPEVVPPTMNATADLSRPTSHEQSEPRTVTTPDLYKTYKQTLHTSYGYPRLLLDVSLPNQLVALLELETKQAPTPRSDQSLTRPWNSSSMNDVHQLPDEHDELATLCFIADRLNRSETELGHSLSRAQFLLEARLAVDVQIASRTPLILSIPRTRAVDVMRVAAGYPTVPPIDRSFPASSRNPSRHEPLGQEPPPQLGHEQSQRLDMNTSNDMIADARVEISRPRSAPAAENGTQFPDQEMVGSSNIGDGDANGWPGPLHRSSTDVFQNRDAPTRPPGLNTYANIVGTIPLQLIPDGGDLRVPHPVEFSVLPDIGPSPSHPGVAGNRSFNVASPAFQPPPHQSNRGQPHLLRRPADIPIPSWDGVLPTHEYANNQAWGMQSAPLCRTMSPSTEGYLGQSHDMARLRCSEGKSDVFIGHRSHALEPHSRLRRGCQHRTVGNDRSNPFQHHYFESHDDLQEVYHVGHVGDIVYSAIPASGVTPHRIMSRPNLAVTVEGELSNVDVADWDLQRECQRTLTRVPRSQAELSEEEDREFAIQRHVPVCSPPPSPPISPSMPPVEAPAVLQILSDLSQTRPVHRAEVSHTFYHTVPRNMAFPSSIPTANSKLVTPVEELMQEAELLFHDIRRSGRKPSTQDKAFLLARDERRRHLKEREKLLLTSRREFIRRAELHDRTWLPEGYSDRPQVPNRLGNHHAFSVPHGPVLTPMRPVGADSIPIPPHRQHLPSTGRPILEGYAPEFSGSPGVLLRPPVNSPVARQRPLAEQESGFRNGGVRHFSSSPRMAVDLTSPTTPHPSLPVISRQVHQRPLCVPDSKDFIHFSTVSEEPWLGVAPQ